MKKKIICISMAVIFLLTGFVGIVSANSAPIAKKPSGQSKFIFGHAASYTCSATDPDGDSVYLKLFHPTNVTAMQSTEWFGPYESGEEVKITFNWRGHVGVYYLKCIAKDINGLKDKSSSLKVSVATIDSENTIFLRINFLAKLFNINPNLLSFLK